MLNEAVENLGFVAIGRNEGERLERCLNSLQRHGLRVVYVDSGSKDASLAVAKKAGAAIVELSSDRPFTAARARNAGFKRLFGQWPDTQHVMFIDGDCELVDGFIPAALKLLHENPAIGVVTGRCRERNPDATIYNRLCDMEWNGPTGEIDACGGIFLVRTATFQSAGGFNPSLIAGEEPEFCIRVREAGETIIRVKEDMCFHDADMRRFGQWWRRAVRAGYSYAQVNRLHSDAYKAERRRAWFWGAILPSLIFATAPLTGGWSGALVILYAASFLKTRRGLIRSGAESNNASIFAAFLVLSKFPNLIGLLNFRSKQFFKQPINIIEYK